jgi:hypothetical protein
MIDAARISISTCIGCGSMREFPTCQGICRERKLELVSGSEYDELAVAAAASRARIQAFLPVVAQLAGTAPRRADWSALYESFRDQARLALEVAAGPPGRTPSDASAPAADTTVVWRCPDCGGLEATQPCIGVCIWRPAEWVQAAASHRARAHTLRDLDLERALFGLLTRLSSVRPRHGEWERNARAFQAQARDILRRHSLA